MDPSRDVLIAQRAAVALKEHAVAAGGPGTDLEPTIGLVFDADWLGDGIVPEPAAFYRASNVPDDLMSAERAVYWTRATQAFLAYDAFIARKLDDLPELADNDDLAQLYRAHDPRVLEAIRVDSRTTDGIAHWQHVPYRWVDGKIEWTERQPDELVQADGDHMGGLLQRMFRVAFRLGADWPDESIAALTPLQAGLVAGLDTLVPNDAGGLDLHPFSERLTKAKGGASSAAARMLEALAEKLSGNSDGVNVDVVDLRD